MTRQYCFDFPELVLHVADPPCPRYTGGVCFPMPQPVEPYTDEEQEVVDSYNNIMESVRTGRPGKGMSGIASVTPTGSTIYPGDVVKA